jgi:hypothetical protein
MKYIAAVLACWLACIGGAIAQERHLQSYTLRHALPEQVVPALTAQLSTGSSVTPYHQQLILNVTDSEYRNIKTLLEQLDTAPRSLLISVRKQGKQFQQNERYGVDGRIGSGAVQVQGGSTQRSGDTRIVVNQGSQRGSSDNSQQVRAVEGMAAFISTGNIVAVRSGPYGQREMTPVESGFYANARIVGDEVIVDIEQRDDRMQQRSIATQSLQTQVRGQIGEWIPLGSISDQRGDSESNYTSYRGDSSSSLADIAIKVERAD